jgi:hypothetical protein
VFLAAEIGVKELRMCAIVEGSQKVGIHVVHGFALQQRLSKAQRRITALSHPLFPVVEDGERLGGRFCSTSHSDKESQARFPGKSKDRLGEVFVDLGATGTPA